MILKAIGVVAAVSLAVGGSLYAAGIDHPSLANTTDTGITVELPGDGGAMDMTCSGDTLTFTTTDVATGVFDCETTTTTAPNG